MRSRRWILSTVGSGICLFSGCSGDGTEPDRTREDTRSSTPTPVPTDQPGTPGDPAFETVGLQTTNVECGDAVDATITVEDDQLTVLGTIALPAGCHRATLRSARVRDGTASLEVTGSSDPTTETPCDQCPSAVQFELTGTFVGGRPARIVVEVHGEEPETFRKSV